MCLVVDMCGSQSIFVLLCSNCPILIYEEDHFEYEEDHYEYESEWLELMIYFKSTVN